MIYSSLKEFVENVTKDELDCVLKIMRLSREESDSHRCVVVFNKDGRIGGHYPLGEEDDIQTTKDYLEMLGFACEISEEPLF